MITHSVIDLKSQIVTCGKAEGSKLQDAFFATFLCEGVRKGTNPTKKIEKGENEGRWTGEMK